MFMHKFYDYVVTMKLKKKQIEIGTVSHLRNDKRRIDMYIHICILNVLYNVYPHPACQCFLFGGDGGDGGDGAAYATNIVTYPISIYNIYIQAD